MGLGDDIIFLGKAEEQYKKTGKKIVPLYNAGWNTLYENVEFISKNKDNNCLTMNARDTSEPSDIHVNYYTQGQEQTILGKRYIWRDFKPSRYRVRLTEKELDFADKVIQGKFVIINPDYKSTFFATNKNWGFHKYQEIVNRLSREIQVVRIMPGGKYTEPKLKNAINIQSENIKNSIAIMSKASFGVTYEGLVTHILSGFNIPVVNIQGGIGIMNYDNNVNLRYDHFKTPCASTYPCAHCDEANENITIDMVYAACKKFL